MEVEHEARAAWKRRRARGERNWTCREGKSTSLHSGKSKTDTASSLPPSAAPGTAPGAWTVT